MKTLREMMDIVEAAQQPVAEGFFGDVGDEISHGVKGIKRQMAGKPSRQDVKDKYRDRAVAARQAGDTATADRNADKWARVHKSTYGAGMSEQSVAEQQLDELSPETLKSYHKKAVDKLTTGDVPLNKFDKREAGAMRAYKKAYNQQDVAEGTDNLINVSQALGKLKGREAFVHIGDPRVPQSEKTQFKRGVIFDREPVYGVEPGTGPGGGSRFTYWLRDESGKEFSAPSRDVFVLNQPVAEGHADQQRRVFKKNGQAVGEVGIDRESSPGVGQWYMKCYVNGVDNSGYDSYDEAVAELRLCLKQGVAEASEEAMATIDRLTRD